jgi:outer membrane immunogenic protein
MKKIILATVLAGVASTSALAADIGARAPYAKAPAMMQAVGNWTGFYVGGNVGYGFMKNTDVISGANASGVAFVASGLLATSIPLDTRGFLGGGQLGYNWQISSGWVVGFEADMSWSDMNKTVAARGLDVSRVMTASEKLDWLGTVRARVGFIPLDSLLVYGTGGLAYGHTSLSTALTRVLIDGTIVCAGNNCQAGATAATKVGWTIGGGAEWGFTKNWSLKAEYLYFDLGSLSHTMTDPVFPSIFNAKAQLNGNIVRAGLNYHF